jgi:hypothetical protein
LLGGLGWRRANFLQAFLELANMVDQVAVLLTALREPPLERRDEGEQSFRLAREVAHSLIGSGGLLTERAHGFVQDLELTTASPERCLRRWQNLRRRSFR